MHFQQGQEAGISPMPELHRKPGHPVEVGRRKPNGIQEEEDEELISSVRYTVLSCSFGKK